MSQSDLRLGRRLHSCYHTLVSSLSNIPIAPCPQRTDSRRTSTRPNCQGPSHRDPSNAVKSPFSHNTHLQVHGLNPTAKTNSYRLDPASRLRSRVVRRGHISLFRHSAVLLRVGLYIQRRQHCVIAPTSVRDRRVPQTVRMFLFSRDGSLARRWAIPEQRFGLIFGGRRSLGCIACWFDGLDQPASQRDKPQYKARRDDP